LPKELLYSDLDSCGEKHY